MLRPSLTPRSKNLTYIISGVCNKKKNCNILIRHSYVFSFSPYTYYSNTYTIHKLFWSFISVFSFLSIFETSLSTFFIDKRLHLCGAFVRGNAETLWFIKGHLRGHLSYFEWWLLLTEILPAR